MKILKANLFILLSWLLPICIFFALHDAAAECLVNGCHKEIASLRMPHAPVASRDCLDCHDQRSGRHPDQKGNEFALNSKLPVLCYECHKQFKGSHFHEPVSEGDCTACHNPHGGTDRYLLKNAQDLTALCTHCHDDVGDDAKVIHGPSAAGACTACHDPHVSNFKSLLKKDQKYICFSCHQQMESEIKEAPHLHEPLKELECNSCHESHKSPYEALLKAPLAETCIECHDDLKRFKRVKTKHIPILKRDSCISCHNAHYSNFPALLDSKEKDLCLTCHGKENTAKANPLRNIKKELAGKKYVHGPIKEGKCSPCHDPHGSDYYRMLTASYPEGFYAPYKKGLYDFCLGCHEENMLRFRDTSVYTKFRNGKLNLHYLHVAKERKGRTCRTCHASHASNNPKLIDDAIPFGEWAIPIRFVLTETGGSCSPGCHRPLRYDRLHPVDY